MNLNLVQLKYIWYFSLTCLFSQIVFHTTNKPALVLTLICSYIIMAVYFYEDARLEAEKFKQV